jgi:hypothetical protein
LAGSHYKHFRIFYAIPHGLKLPLLPIRQKIAIFTIILNASASPVKQHQTTLFLSIKKYSPDFSAFLLLLFHFLFVFI